MRTIDHASKPSSHVFITSVTSPRVAGGYLYVYLYLYWCSCVVKWPCCVLQAVSLWSDGQDRDCVIRMSAFRSFAVISSPQQRSGHRPRLLHGRRSHTLVHRLVLNVLLATGEAAQDRGLEPRPLSSRATCRICARGMANFWLTPHSPRLARIHSVVGSSLGSFCQNAPNARFPQWISGALLHEPS